MGIVKWVPYALIALGVGRALFPVEICETGGFRSVGRMVNGILTWPWESCPSDPRGFAETPIPMAGITAVQALILIGVGVAWIAWRQTSRERRE